MTKGRAFPHIWQDGRNSQGVVLLIMALLAGAVGGLTGIGASAWEYGLPLAAHGILLDFYVIIPAFIGGLGRIALPKSAGFEGKSFHLMDWCAVSLLLTGFISALSPLMGFAYGFDSSLVLWSVGTSILAANTLAYILENRRGPFLDLSCFAWSQLAVSAGMMVLAPSVAWLSIRLGPQSEAGVLLLTSIVSIPLKALAIATTIGMMGVAFFPPRQSLPRAAILMLGVVGFLLPLIWLKSLVAGAFLSDRYAEIGIGLPTFVLMAVFVRKLWRPAQCDLAAIIWSLGAMLILTASGAMNCLSQTADTSHAGVLYAAIGALFGSYYAWQRRELDIALPSTFGVAHFFTYFSGVLLLMSPWQSSRLLGHVMMAVCLAFVSLMILRFYFSGRKMVRVESGLRGSN